MSFPERVRALLLVGGNVKRMPAEEPTVPSKGYVDVGGLPMAARTLQALRQSRRIGAITLVTPLENPDLSGAWEGVSSVAPARDSLYTSLYSGLSKIEPTSDPVVLVAGDLPFLTPEAVDDFVERCSQHDEAALWYCFVSKANSQAKYPQLPHTWAKLNGTQFCGGGITVLRRSASEQVRPGFEAMTSGRKSVMKLVKALGFGTLIRYCLGKLTIPQAAAAMERIMGVPVCPVESPYAETAFNVDDYENLQMARALCK